MIRAVIFDLGNTLITCPPWFRVELHTLVSETLGELGRQGCLAVPAGLLEQADQLYAAIHEQSRTAPREIRAEEVMMQVAAALGLTLEPGAVDAALAAVYRACVPFVEPCGGAYETLAGLRQAGYRLAVLSNARYGPFVFWSLEAARLKPYLEAIIPSADVGWRKPSPQVFWLLLERLGVPAHEAVYIGDYYPYDIVGAKAAGMRAIWLRAPHSPVGYEADAEVDGLAEVGPLVEYWRLEGDQGDCCT